MTIIDKSALRKKYREERKKRLRTDGNNQYSRLDKQLSSALEDPYVKRYERKPKSDHVTFAFVGGGFAGLVTGAHLVDAGIKDVRIIDKGGDFGGTWYWNRYPGAQCDTASMVYMPMLEETGHIPTEKYAHAPEILGQCKRIGKQYNLYDNALFHTIVEELEWDEANNRWIVYTDRGDKFTAQYVAVGSGGLSVPKLPGIPGLESFQGHSFHTTQWDYDYTGGDPLNNSLDKLNNKRIAIIGTGATAIQCIPHLANACQELYVFQRTPSSVDVRNNKPIDPEWFKENATKGWQKNWLENFASNQIFGDADEDLVMDGWTDLSRRIRQRINATPKEKRNIRSIMAAFEESDFEKMEEIRSRVDTIVKEKETAQNLKAWYQQLCKRPCFHDTYLQSFNVENTFLVDTNGKGVERITSNAVVVEDKEYEVDCIIYASGFEARTNHTRGFKISGRNGLDLYDYWSKGMRSKHGIHVHGFPNAFIVQPTQGANLISNVTHNLTDAGKTIAKIIKHAISNDFDQIEVTKEAEQAWLNLIISKSKQMTGTPCTPGYYNNEGLAQNRAARSYVGHPKGAMAYFKYIDKWRNNGEFEGINFRKRKT